MKAPQHCLMCGNTHSGKCHPESFVYFRCDNCEQVVDMPRDAAAFGLEYCFCGCGAPADDTWKSLPTSEGLAAMKAQHNQYPQGGGQ